MIESLHMQHCSLRGCIRTPTLPAPPHPPHPLAPAYAVFGFQNKQDGLNDPKGNYNLHYDDVRGDVFWPLQGTTPATLEKNKSQKGLPLEIKNTQNHDNRRLGLITQNTQIGFTLYMEKTPLSALCIGWLR